MEKQTIEALTEKLYAAKRAHRKRLAALPIHEKIKILVRLQKMAEPLVKAQGKQVRVWEI